MNGPHQHAARHVAAPSSLQPPPKEALRAAACVMAWRLHRASLRLLSRAQVLRVMRAARRGARPDMAVVWAAVVCACMRLCVVLSQSLIALAIRGGRPERVGWGCAFRDSRELENMCRCDVLP